MNYSKDKAAAQDLINNSKKLILEIQKTNKSMDRSKLRRELDKKAKIYKNI